MATNASQPTLSHQIRALEARLGVSLVERAAGSIELTPIGREIASRARKVLLEVRDIRDLSGRSKDSLAGTLRFGVSPTLGPYLMPEIVAALHREHPDLRLYIREGIPDDQAMELSRGALDLLLGPLPIAGSELEIEPLFRERLVIACASDHPLASRTELTTADLRGCEMLSLDRRHHFHRQVAALCEEVGAVLLRDYEGTSLDSLRQMVASGLGIALLPELYVRSEAGGAAGVTILDLNDLTATRSIALGWRRGAAYAALYRVIADRIRQAAVKVIETS